MFNLVLLGFSVIALLAALAFFYSRSAETLEQPKIAEKVDLAPKNAFQQNQQAYQKIQEPALSLQFTEPNIPLPDLRNVLNYYGSNKRPDADPKNSKLYLSLGDPKAIFSLQPKSPLYLIRDKGTRKLSLSPNNAETPLWIAATPLPSGVRIEVKMIGVNGKVTAEPKEFSAFTLTEKPAPPQTPGAALGKWRADGALLARQKARWVGHDLFLRDHGGETFEPESKRQRLDFGDENERYSVFVQPNEFLIWKDDRWQRPAPEENTRDYPLLAVKKMDEKLMNLELWDKEGKSKVTYNLIKSNDPIPKIDVARDFQFIGARTKIHFMFNVGGKREIVGPEDWFLLGPDGWQKLSKVKDIDDYVNGDLRGVLLVIDSIGLSQREKVLKGSLYNNTRSDVAEVEIPLKTANVKKAEEQEPPSKEEAAPVVAPESEAQ